MRSTRSAAWLLALVPTLALAQHVHGSGAGLAASASAAPVTPGTNGMAAANPLGPGGSAQGSVASMPGMPKPHEGLSWSVSLSNSLGLGTFVDPAYFASLGSFASVGANYLFTAAGRKMNVNAGWSVAYQATQNLPDTGRRVSPSDLRLGWSMPNAWSHEKWGISLAPSAGLIVPTTLESWHATLISSLSVGLSANKRVGDFGLRLSVNASKGLYALPFTPVAPSSLDQWNNNIVLCRTGEAYCGSGGLNPAFALGVGGGVSWSLTERLSAAVNLTYGYSFRNAATFERDALSPKVLDADGHPVASLGLGRSDTLSGSVSVSYGVSDNVFIDFSVSNGGPPLMIDPTTGQKMPRFPWFSWGQLAGNPTRAGVGLSASF